jgi:hypothetical protein
MEVNDYGLVPGKAVKNFEVYKAGQLCGFEPHIADKLVARGLWKPTNAGTAAVAEETRQAKQVEEAEGESPFLVAVDSGTLKIPRNWRKAHHAKQKSWAKSIAGENVAAEKVDGVIAAAVKEQEDALKQD